MDQPDGKLIEAFAGPRPELSTEPSQRMTVAYRRALAEWHMRADAAYRYAQADALLAERSKGRG